MEDQASQLTLIASGLFFLTGLVTGAWKYVSIAKSPAHEAPRYVSVAHQASLLYAFAALLLLEFLRFSPYSETVNVVVVAVPLFFFALAIATYIAHGLLRDTDNQFEEPHRLGKFVIPAPVFHLIVWLSIIGEVGGFLILFVGYVDAQFGN